ncbi:LysR family transcriptional regulator [Pararhodobacter marinus]|uniref:LysR family transcriptional regulator n=1 Tax=Pararhodobacter marinus TaxID=2184063 RepID=A0A2U2CIF9_9RHOB|nr:LysR family transcriptional regulator [Pararhodobacter marinus]PWE31670.1 LysR family transcriptional regulator [Pararhodobacter marinus]
MDAFHSLDWSLVQAFLSVAETGSLSAAARALGRSQPTLGRQIRAIEDQLGVELFHRQARGLVLTDTGAALIDPARQMRAAANAMALAAAGREQRLEGSVRITASVAVSVWHLPRVLAAIRRQEPRIALELVPSDRSSNLLYREADIAIRMYRPTQQDLITRHLGDTAIGAFAAHSYIERRGLPATPADLARHDIIGQDRETLLIEGMQSYGIPASREMFAFRCDDVATGWELVRAGAGIGFAQRSLGQRDPLVRELDFGIALPTLPVWLTAHEAMRRTPRVRRVWDLLADALVPAMDLTR